MEGRVEMPFAPVTEEIKAIRQGGPLTVSLRNVWPAKSASAIFDLN